MKGRNPFLTASMLSILNRLRHPNDEEADDEHCLTEAPRGGWWIGASRVRAKDCMMLLQLCAIGHTEDLGSSRVYWRTRDGERLAVDSQHVPEIVRRTRSAERPE